MLHNISPQNSVEGNQKGHFVSTNKFGVKRTSQPTIDILPSPDFLSTINAGTELFVARADFLPDARLPCLNITGS